MALTVRTNRLPEHECSARAELDLTRIPKAGRFDVVVVGGGTAGAPAAIAAGQEGLSVAVIEPQSFLGGIGTGGGIHTYYHGLQTGVQVELDRRTDEWNKRIGGKAMGFHPEAKKLALQEMADQAGVRCFYHSFFAGAVLEGHALRGIVAEGEDGLYWLEAGTVLDCSGDADVAAAAGAPFTFGREGDHAPQPYSLAPGYAKNTDTVGYRNFDAGYTDPTNARDQSRAQREGRAHLARDAYDLGSRMIYVSPILGLRESRFIEAEYMLTLADQRAQRRFPDAIARAKAHYDNHAKDYENETLDAAIWVAALGHWHTQMCHDVPYRCLLPRRVENLLVACRASGMTHDAHNLFRMQRDMQALGEAAAVAAACAQRSSRTVRAVDVKAVQKRLVERGALPAEALDGQGVGTVIPRDEALEQAALAKLLATFGTKKEPHALTELLRRGDAVHAELRAVLASGDANAQLLAAIVLGLQGQADGAGVLQATLRARRDDPTEGHRTYPRWQGALLVLRKLGLRKTGSLGLVLDLLRDEPLDIHKAVAALRALSPEAGAGELLEPLRQLMRRQDLQAVLVLQDSQGKTERLSAQDRRFELDLAAAQEFLRLGAPDEAQPLIERHLDDPRALVRGYAQKAAVLLPQTARAAS